jgi:hypothetical protein
MACMFGQGQLRRFDGQAMTSAFPPTATTTQSLAGISNVGLKLIIFVYPLYGHGALDFVS